MNLALRILIITSIVVACESPKRRDSDQESGTQAGSIDNIDDLGAPDMIIGSCDCDLPEPCECMDFMIAGAEADSEVDSNG